MVRGHIAIAAAVQLGEEVALLTYTDKPGVERKISIDEARQIAAENPSNVFVMGSPLLRMRGTEAEVFLQGLGQPIASRFLLGMAHARPADRYAADRGLDEEKWIFSDSSRVILEAPRGHKKLCPIRLYPHDKWMVLRGEEIVSRNLLYDRAIERARRLLDWPRTRGPEAGRLTIAIPREAGELILDDGTPTGVFIRLDDQATAQK